MGPSETKRLLVIELLSRVTQCVAAGNFPSPVTLHLTGDVGTADHEEAGSVLRQISPVNLVRLVHRTRRAGV